MFTLFVCSTYENRHLVSFIKSYIRERVKNIEIVSTWDERFIPNYSEVMEKTWKELSRAKCLLAVWPFGKGSMFEIGYAMGANKRVVLYLPNDLTHERIHNCVPSEFSDFEFAYPFYTINASNIGYMKYRRFVMSDNINIIVSYLDILSEEYSNGSIN